MIESRPLDIAEEIAAFLRMVMDQADVMIDSELAVIGVDSLSLVELAVFIERRWGTDLIDSGLHRDVIRTPLDIAEFLIAADRRGDPHVAGLAEALES